MRTQEEEREKERKVRESEQKHIEGMKKRMYAEQVAAARNRIESARAGGVPSLKSSYNDEPGGLVPSSTSSQTSERNKPPPIRRYSRQHEPTPPLVPPRREASEPNLPTVARTYPTPPRSSYHDSSNSPGSSRPPSLSTPPTPNSLTSLITPSTPSPPFASSDDVRLNQKNRSSYAAHSNSSGSLFGDLSASYPMWTANGHSLDSVVFRPVPMIPVPAMMPVGYVMMDMPLLPPTPPFMMQQYSRQSSSQGSGSGSSRGNLSRESSQERVSGGGGQRDSQSSHNHSHPRSASFPEPPSSRRYQSSSSFKSHVPSTEPRRSSMPQQREKSRQPTSQQRPQHTPHQSPRPRPPLQQPSPWTGLPTQSGKLPNGVAQSRSPHSTLRSSSSRKHLVS